MDKTDKKSVLKEIFDIFAEDTITDEQINRILAPVLKLIREGKFRKTRRDRIAFFTLPLLSMAAVIVLIATVVISQRGVVENKRITVIEPLVPLSNFLKEGDNELLGRAYHKNSGLEGVVLQLQDTKTGTIVSTITNSDGQYTFSKIPDGVYKVKVVLPEDMRLVNGGTEGYITIDGTTDIKFGMDNERTAETIDIEVWEKD